MQKLIKLIKTVVYRNLSIHTDDSGTVTGFTLYDIKPFDSAPFEAVLATLNLGWTIIVNDTPAMSNAGRMMPPRAYIGKGGATLDDLATALESVETS
jgi:hypothetical protein